MLSLVLQPLTSTSSRTRSSLSATVKRPWTICIAESNSRLAPKKARLRQGFETRRDVDAVAIDVFVIDDDIAHVQANPKLNTPLWRNLHIALGHLPLDIDGTAYGVDDTGKLNKDAVARRLNNAPAVFHDLGIDD